MTGWIFGLLLAGATALAWWFARRRAQAELADLRKVLDDLAAGRSPDGFVFPENGPYSHLDESLRRVAAEQTRLRQQISREQANLATILGSMEEGVMVVDAQHVLRQINPSFLRLFDLKSDPRGQTVLHTLRLTPVEEMVSAALKTGEPQSQEVSVNGGKPVRHFAVRAEPMRDEEGRSGVVTIFRDSTRLKQLEDVRREFVSNVSHELRTPLSVFHGYVENLLDDPTMPRKSQVEIFEILRKHSLRLNALVEDLLIIARLESRHDTLQREPVLLEDFLRQTAADWEARGTRKKVVIDLDLEPNLPPVSADLLKLEQVLNNLLENAIKYTDQGGRITLGARRVEDWLEVRVQDTGSGIPPTDLPHIFERFYRADKARTREQGGTGLGLSIVKHIVQTHGGSVFAESTYGKGTAIIFRLPLEPAGPG
ncbi:MAG TPA: ATP-binding protein [Chthoniobacteraceae bacterium]|jgi:two-component system phosphate regulon sensor histidine kinase PhoR